MIAESIKINCDKLNVVCALVLMSKEIKLPGFDREIKVNLPKDYSLKNVEEYCNEGKPGTMEVKVKDLNPNKSIHHNAVWCLVYGNFKFTFIA